MGKFTARPKSDAPSSLAALRGTGRGRSSSPPWLLALGVLIGALSVLAAWSWRQSTANGEAVDVEADHGESPFSMIREALFAKDGVSQFDNIRDHRENGRSAFANVDYWNDRYNKTDKAYDWYGTWNGDTDITFKPHIVRAMPEPVTTVLNLGCGSSRLTGELFDDGYKDIMNIDISQVAVDKMASKFSGVEGVRFLQMDASNMTFADASFDFVIEKGTLDAMYTGSSDLVRKVVPQIFRVLRPGGLFASITFGPAKTRRDLNATSGEGQLKPGWGSFRTVELRGSALKQVFYIHLMRKPSTAAS